MSDEARKEAQVLWDYLQQMSQSEEDILAELFLLRTELLQRGLIRALTREDDTDVQHLRRELYLASDWQLVTPHLAARLYGDLAETVWARLDLIRGEPIAVVSYHVTGRLRWQGATGWHWMCKDDRRMVPSLLRVNVQEGSTVDVGKHQVDTWLQRNTAWVFPPDRR